MLSRFSILLLVTFSSFLHFTIANTATQNVKNQSEKTFTCCNDEWKEFASFLNLVNIADKIQNVPFVSNLLNIPLKAHGDRFQSEAPASPNTADTGPEHVQRSLEVVVSEETSKIARSFETLMNSTLALCRAFHNALESVSSDTIPSNNAQLSPLLKKVVSFVAIVRDDIREKLPLPSTAPGHAEREKHVSVVLDHFQPLVVRIARNHEIEQDVVERHLARVKPILHDVGVLIGDVAELYPAAIEALVLSLSAMLLPEAVFLRSLVILYCFGPYVLGKDAIGGWLLKHLSEASRIW